MPEENPLLPRLMNGYNNSILGTGPASPVGGIVRGVQNVPPFDPNNPRGFIARAGDQLQTIDPNASIATNNIRGAVGSVMSAPADAADAIVDKISPVLKNASETFTMTHAERDARDARLAQEENARLNAEMMEQTRAAQDDASALLMGLMGPGAAGGGSPRVIDAGAVSNGGGYGAYQLPETPAPQGYGNVQATIDKTRPDELDSAEWDERRRQSVMTGLIGGMLQASMNGQSFGNVLGGGGLGALQAGALSDEKRNQAKENFRKSMDEYWMRTAGIQQKENESREAYANRVWQNQVKQMEINADAAMRRAEANQSSLKQAGDKIYLNEVVDGRRRLTLLNPDDSDRLATMKKNLKEVIGEDAAKSVISSLAAQKNPTHAMGIVTLANLKENGKYLDFVEGLRESNEAFAEQWDNAGVSQTMLGVSDEKMITDLVNKRRDAMLIDIITRDKNLRNAAFNLGDMK